MNMSGWWLGLGLYTALLLAVAWLGYAAGRHRGIRRGYLAGRRVAGPLTLLEQEDAAEEAWHDGYVAGAEAEGWRREQEARIEADSVPAWLYAARDPELAGMVVTLPRVEADPVPRAIVDQPPRIFDALIASWPGPVLPRFVPRPPVPRPARRQRKGRPTPRQRDQVRRRTAATA